jgi:hypothetical protein
VVNCRLDPRSSKTYLLVLCTQQQAVRAETVRVSRNQDKVSEWRDMSTL